MFEVGDLVRCLRPTDVLVKDHEYVIRDVQAVPNRTNVDVHVGIMGTGGNPIGSIYDCSQFIKADKQPYEFYISHTRFSYEHGYIHAPSPAHAIVEFFHRFPSLSKCDSWRLYNLRHVTVAWWKRDQGT